jgi:histidinol-phosphate aminotransferase
MIDINSLVRKNILSLTPYSSARNEFDDSAEVYLDANENPYETGLNRYPDPFQKALKKKIGELRRISANNILLGNGSDEILDLLFRTFCEPRIDNVITHNPSYGMYPVLASLNDVEIRKINLEEGFELNSSAMIEASDKNTKLFFICSPNNPSGNILNKSEIKKILRVENTLVIIDEAYIDFTNEDSWLNELPNYDNLIVCQTLSKAWGLAGLRIGICFASAAIIRVLNAIKPPYNINVLSQQMAIETLENEDQFNTNLEEILCEKAILETELEGIACVEKVYPSEANFLLVKVTNAGDLYNFLIKNKVVVRNRSTEYLCENCVRISIGTPIENNRLLNCLKNYAN